MVRFLLQAARWVLIAVVVSVALAVLYRVAPDRDAPKMRWVSVGAVVATVLWLIASIGFSIYVAASATTPRPTAPVAGIVVTLFWLWITSYAVLLGAEINAEAEQQTVRDTTKGPEAPMGERGAVKADSLPTEGDGGDAQKRNEPRRTHEQQHRVTGANPTHPRARPRRTPRSAIWSRNMSADLSRLVRNEIQLAQTEITAKLKNAGVASVRSAGPGCWPCTVSRC